MTESGQRVAEVLGGTKVLGSRPKNTDEWMTMIETGLPTAAVEALKEVVGLDDPSLAVTLGVSIRTLARVRASEGRLDSVVSDRRPIDLAKSEPGAREIENLLLCIEHGVYS